MKLSSKDLLNLKIIDEIIPEPLGGAHRDKNAILDTVRVSIEKNLNEFKNLSKQEIFDHRKQKFLSIGRTKGFSTDSEIRDSLTLKTNIFMDLLNKSKKYKNYLYIFAIIFFVILGIILF